MRSPVNVTAQAKVGCQSGMGGSSPQTALSARFADAEPARLVPANGEPMRALWVER